MAWRTKGSSGSRARYNRVALLALFGLLTTVTLGTMREALDVSGLSGVSTDKMSAEDASDESAPADKARAGATLDVGPVALLTVEAAPPPRGEFLSFVTFLVDLCRPGHERGLERPPRPIV